MADPEIMLFRFPIVRTKNTISEMVRRHIKNWPIDRDVASKRSGDALARKIVNYLKTEGQKNARI